MTTSRLTVVHVVASLEVGGRERVLPDVVRHVGSPGARL